MHGLVRLGLGVVVGFGALSSLLWASVHPEYVGRRKIQSQHDCSLQAVKVYDYAGKREAFADARCNEKEGVRFVIDPLKLVDVGISSAGTYSVAHLKVAIPCKKIRRTFAEDFVGWFEEKTDQYYSYDPYVYECSKS